MKEIRTSQAGRSARDMWVTLLVCLALCCTFAPIKEAKGAKKPTGMLKNIRFGKTTDGVRIVLDFSAEPQYVLTHRNPNRFRVHLFDVESGVTAKDILLPKDVGRVELNPKSNHRLDCILDVRSDLRLAGQGILPDPPRLFMDFSTVKASESAEPKSSNARQEDRTERRANNAEGKGPVSGAEGAKPATASSTSTAHALRSNDPVSPSAAEGPVNTGPPSGEPVVAAVSGSIAGEAREGATRGLPGFPSPSGEVAQIIRPSESDAEGGEPTSSSGFWEVRRANAQEPERHSGKVPSQSTHELRKKVRVPVAEESEESKLPVSQVSFGKERLLVEMGRVEEALRSLERTLRENPPREVHEEGLYLRALWLEILAEEGKVEFDAVVDAFMDAAAKVPDAPWLPDAILRAGKAYMRLGLYYEALGQFRRVLNRFPTSPRAEEALFWEGEAAFQVRRYDEARAAYSRLMNKYPDSELYKRALVRYGECLAFLGKPDEAETIFERAFKEWPELLVQLSAGTLLTMGRSLRAKNRIGDATDLFLMAVNIHPDSEEANEALMELARSYDNAGEVDKAATTYALLAELFPETPLAYRARIRLAQMAIAKMPIRADLPPSQIDTILEPIEVLRRMVQTAPLEILDEVYYALARGQMELARYRRSLDTYAELLREFPDSPLSVKAREEVTPVFRRLVMLMKRDKDDFDVVKTYETVFLPMGIATEDDFLLYNLAESYAALDLLKEAVNLGEKAIETTSNPHLEQAALSDLFRWETLRGNSEDAARLLRTYIERFPNGKNRREFQLQLAEHLWRALDYPAAAATFSELIPPGKAGGDLVAAKASFDLGKLYKETGLTSNAVHFVNRARTLLPEDSEPEYATRFLTDCNLFLADELAKQGADEVARSLYSEVIESKAPESDRAWAAYRTALLERKLGDQDGFKSSLKRLSEFGKSDIWPMVAQAMDQASKLRGELEAL